MNFKPLFCIVTLILLSNCEKSMSNDKFVELHVSSKIVDYYIVLNDVMVFQEYKNSPVTHTIPVNQWMFNGENNLLISVNFGQSVNEQLAHNLDNKKLDISINICEKHGDSEKKYTIGHFTLKPSSSDPNQIASSSIQKASFNSKSGYEPDENGDVIIGELNSKIEKDTWMDFTQTLTLGNLKLPDWSFKNADFVDTAEMSDAEYEAFYRDLYAQYESLWTLLKNQDKEKLLQLVAHRAKEYDLAFGLQPGTKLVEFERSISSAFSHDDLYLDEFIPINRTKISKEANGKLFRLKVYKVGEPLIFYSHNRGSFTRFYDFYFMKKDGKWIIIR